MTIADITTTLVHAPAHAGEATSNPVIWASAVVGGILGLISGLAEYNELYTGHPNFLAICFFTFGGAAVGIGIGTAAGFVLAKVRGRRA